MICDKCGKEFENGNRPDGIPNGCGIVLNDGRTITVCADCIIRLGEMTETEKAAFFAELNERD